MVRYLQSQGRFHGITWYANLARHIGRVDLARVAVWLNCSSPIHYLAERISAIKRAQDHSSPPRDSFAEFH